METTTRPTTVSKEKYRPRLVEYVQSKAEILLDTSPLEKICGGSGDREILKVLDEKYQGQADLEKGTSSSMSGSLKQIVDDMAKM